MILDVHTDWQRISVKIERNKEDYSRGVTTTGEHWRLLVQRPSEELWISEEDPKQIGRVIQRHGSGNLYAYTICYVGGLGPNVWDKEISIEAENIIDAAKVAQGIADEVGGWVVSVQQED